LLPTIPQNHWTDSKSSKFVSACADTTAQSSYLHQSARVEHSSSAELHGVNWLVSWDGVMWTGLVWLRIGTGGELL
jgi:hypothetical protein